MYCGGEKSQSGGGGDMGRSHMKNRSPCRSTYVCLDNFIRFCTFDTICTEVGRKTARAAEVVTRGRSQVRNRSLCRSTYVHFNKFIRMCTLDTICTEVGRKKARAAEELTWGRSQVRNRSLCRSTYVCLDNFIQFCTLCDHMYRSREKKSSSG